VNILNIIGIKREPEFSHIRKPDDDAIFDAVVACLQHLGCKVKVAASADFNPDDCNGVFCMARGKAAIEHLKKLENNCLPIVNSPSGIENCRKRVGEGVRGVRGVEGVGGWWIKSGTYTVQPEDVAFAKNREEAEKILRGFAERGIDSFVVSKHIEGDEIKFYGVNKYGFFRCFFRGAQPSKFDCALLRQICEKTAETRNVSIYGGDAIIDREGRIHIIDFNDFPSFAPCRVEAAPIIAQCIYDYAKGRFTV
jgi:hypothetical protein